MPAERVTIYEVAKRAQVSISTVSNALNKPERVSEATRSRILAAADELGFVPKVQAVSLARRGTGRVGVMAPFSSYASYLRRLAGVLRAAEAAQVEVVVYDHESAALATSPVLATMPILGRLDGLIVMGLEIEPAIAERLHRGGLPTVAVDAASSRFTRVVADDIEGGRLAAKHLAARGHLRYGYLLEQQRTDYESQAIQRLGGFKEIVEATTDVPLRIAACENSIASARAAAGELLDRPGRPTAIAAHFDLLALGVLRAAHDRGIRVPEELAIMGFDDGEAAAAADLTTVHQPFEESGSIALDLLLGRLVRDQPRSTVLLELSVVERGTT